MLSLLLKQNPHYAPVLGTSSSANMVPYDVIAIFSTTTIAAKYYTIGHAPSAGAAMMT